MKIASLKLIFNDLPAKSVCLILLSSKNDEPDGNKTFEVYSSYITVASNIFKETKTLIDLAPCYCLYSRKSVTF